jgi:hypothetical protein
MFMEADAWNRIMFELFRKNSKEWRDRLPVFKGLLQCVGDILCRSGTGEIARHDDEFPVAAGFQ